MILQHITIANGCLAGERTKKTAQEKMEYYSAVNGEILTSAVVRMGPCIIISCGRKQSQKDNS